MITDGTMKTMALISLLNKLKVAGLVRKRVNLTSLLGNCAPIPKYAFRVAVVSTYQEYLTGTTYSKCDRDLFPHE